MSVIELEEVEVFLPAPLTTAQQAMVEDLIDLIEGELAEYLDRPLEPTVFEAERYVVNLTEPTIFLKHTPLISVDTVVADGMAVDPVMFTTRSWGLDFAGFNTLAINDPVIWTPTTAHFGWWQAPDVLALASGDYPQGVWEITYTAGLDGRNINSIRSVLIKAIRRELASIFRGYNGIYSSIKVEDYSATVDARLNASMRGSFTDGELKLLSQLARKAYVA